MQAKKDLDILLEDGWHVLAGESQLQSATCEDRGQEVACTGLLTDKKLGCACVKMT